MKTSSGHNIYELNRPFPSTKNPHSLNEAKCKNLSCENEFYLDDNKKSFSQEKFCTWPRFKTEACGILEMAYYYQFVFRFFEIFLVGEIVSYWHNLTTSLFRRCLSFFVYYLFFLLKK